MGNEQGQGRRLGCLPMMLGVAGLTLVGTVMGIYGSRPSPPADPAVTARERADGAALFVGERAVRKHLKDPSSAVFTEGTGRTVGGRHVACGQVNARNSFGAMAGAEPWLAVIEQDVVMIHSSANHKQFAQIWNRYCTGSVDAPGS